MDIFSGMLLDILYCVELWFIYQIDRPSIYEHALLLKRISFTNIFKSSVAFILELVQNIFWWLGALISA